MKKLGRLCGLLLIPLGLSVNSIPNLSAQIPATPTTIPGLGTATFPTSTTSPQAQADFMRALLLLHLFEYPDAAKAFQSAEKIDPTFAMAYWGEAMTYNHPIWNQLDVPAGQAALNKYAATPEARASLVKDPRQRAFLAAVEILYDGKGTKPERDALYAAAMQRLAASYPADDEAQLFYALALLGRSEGVRDVPTYLQAASIAKAVYRRNPRHPGAAHYWIHGMDDPEHAAGALEAARALSKIAPDAGHAQHMCSHIFIALGMWDETVEANVNAVRVVDAQNRAAGHPILTCGHYVVWLQYAYYQQGRFQDGDRTLAACKRTASEVRAWMIAHPGQHFGAATMPEMVASAHYDSMIMMRGFSVIESRHWNGPAAAMTVDYANLIHDAGWDPFITGYAAAQRGDIPLAQESLKKIREIEKSPPTDATSDSEVATYLDVIADELSGLIAGKSGDMPGGIAQVQRAAATYEGMPYDFGPPPTLKPPHELLGELYLADKQPQKAVEAFQTSLKHAPNRAQSLLGLARAQDAAGNKSAATATYTQLIAMWKMADAGDQDLAEAQRHTAATRQ